MLVGKGNYVSFNLNPAGSLESLKIPKIPPLKGTKKEKGQTIKFHENYSYFWDQWHPVRVDDIRPSGRNRVFNSLYILSGDRNAFLNIFD